MKTVYLLNSKSFPDKYYVGITSDLSKRLLAHNSGKVTHTSKYLPWVIQTYIVFSDIEKAIAFEKYLKSHSGRAFSKKRL